MVSVNHKSGHNFKWVSTLGLLIRLYPRFLPGWIFVRISSGKLSYGFTGMLPGELSFIFIGQNVAFFFWLCLEGYVIWNSLTRRFLSSPLAEERQSWRREVLKIEVKFLGAGYFNQLFTTITKHLMLGTQH